MTKGATIQLMTMLKPIWIQISLAWNTSCSFSYWTLQRMGYIMTSRPMAEAVLASTPQRVDEGEARGGLTNGHRHANKPALLQGRPDVVDKVAKQDADEHGQEDPHGQEAVEEAEGAEGG